MYDEQVRPNAKLEKRKEEKTGTRAHARHMMNRREAVDMGQQQEKLHYLI